MSEASGTGILNLGTLTVKNSKVSLNRRHSPDDTTFGGGIFSRGTLRVESSEISRNIAERAGGIFIRGPTIISDSLIKANFAEEIGGVQNSFTEGTVTISGSSFIGNLSEFIAGGIDNS